MRPVNNNLAGQKLPFIEDSFARYCKGFGIKCSFSDGIVFIKTNFSEWRIYHDERIVKKLHHSNYMTCLRRHKYNQGFHVQSIPDSVGNDIYDVLRYIAKHDRCIMHHKKTVFPYEACQNASVEPEQTSLEGEQQPES